MLRREDALRLSEHTLRQYKRGSAEDYVRITEALQAQTAAEFGLSAEVGSMLLRRADSFARSEAERAEIVQLSLYRRHNRCVDGDLQVGDAAPSLLLQPLPRAGADLPPPVAMPPAAPSATPLVVFAGSYS